MLSVNYIANFVNKNQTIIENEKYLLKNFEINELNNEFIHNKIKQINNEKKNSYKDLYDCFNDFFEKEEFGLIKEDLILNSSLNKNQIFTFFSSIFAIGDENYYLLNEEEQKQVIKLLIHQMDNDIFLKNYYKEFNYDTNKHFSKEKIINVLKEGYNLRVNEYFNILIKYAIDYLGINVIIFEVKNKEIINKYLIQSNKYTLTYNHYLPHYFMIKENDEFKPIMMKNKLYKNYLEYEDTYKIKEYLNNEYINNITNIDNTTEKYLETNKEIKKMKIDELRDYCISKNINIYKISEKTKKEIKKTKDELLSELSKLNE